MGTQWPAATSPITSLATLVNPALASLGPVTNAGVGAGGATGTQVQQALDESGLSVSGVGIKVGVLSDSFNNLGGAALDEADGALPSASNIQVLKDLSSGGTDEGRAMMQIVHDIAPSASLAFYTADNSEQDFANGILALAAAGCKVITDDVNYFDEPFFQNGVIAQAIQTVEAEGVTYVTAAGNEASNGYQASWNPISGTFGGVNLTDAESFNGSLVQTVTINTEGTGHGVPLLLEWNQPFGQATSNLEMLVFDSSGQLVGTATNASSGEPTNPWLGLELNQSGTYFVAVENLSGPDPGLIKEITEGDGLPATISGANVGTVVGHALTPGAITTGAVNSADTPGFGVNPQSEFFSSSGAGSELLFANNGAALSQPDVLSPVAVSGVDNIHTTVSDLSDFFGTSAATASLAGVAALILSSNPNLTPAQVEQIMKGSAIAMPNSAVSGAGLVRVGAALSNTLPLQMMLAAGSNSGVPGGDITDVTKPEIVGTGVAGATITLDIGATQVGSTTVAANGSWAFSIGPLALGFYALTATETSGAKSASAVLDLSIAHTIGNVGDFFQIGTEGGTVFVRSGTGQLQAFEFGVGGQGLASAGFTNAGSAFTIDAATTVVGGGEDFFGLGAGEHTAFLRMGSGQLAAWEFNSSNQAAGAAGFTNAGGTFTIDAATTVVGAGEDFFGLGAGEHTAFLRMGSGQLSAWEFNSSDQATGAAGFTNAGAAFTIDSAMTVVGGGEDFFGLGAGEHAVFLRSGAGALEAWEFNGADQATGAAGFTNVGETLTMDSATTVVGAGEDALGTGQRDIFARDGEGQLLLWQFNAENQMTGYVGLALANGAAFTIDTATTVIGASIDPSTGQHEIELSNGSGMIDWDLNGTSLVNPHAGMSSSSSLQAGLGFNSLDQSVAPRSDPFGGMAGSAEATLHPGLFGTGSNIV